MLTLCILLDVLLHIYYKGIIFVSEIKQNTNSTDPSRSLKSAQKTMKILRFTKKKNGRQTKSVRTSQLCLATMR